MIRAIAAFVLVAVSAVALAQAPANPPVRIRGSVEKLDGNMLTVKARNGQSMNVKLADNFTVMGVSKASAADIGNGKFIGTTTVGERNGNLIAEEVHIFPENMRGTGEGSRPYDLKPNSSMTNATVEQSVVGNDGHTLNIKYKDGEKKVLVSPETPVVTYVPADRSDLKPGAKVIAFMKKLPDGSFETNRINVGRDGLTPPM
jgi:hypothetical protein